MKAFSALGAVAFAIMLAQPASAADLWDEAADEIERLQKENERLREELADVRADAAMLRLRAGPDR
jgi:hypothetical protein